MPANGPTSSQNGPSANGPVADAQAVGVPGVLGSICLYAPLTSTPSARHDHPSVLSGWSHAAEMGPTLLV